MDYNEYNINNTEQSENNTGGYVTPNSSSYTNGSYIYRADGTTYNTGHIPEDKPKKEKKEHKGVKKFFASLGLGLTFGVAAASALLVMNDLTGNTILGSKSDSEVDLEEYEDQIRSDILKDLAVTAQAGSDTVVTNTLSSTSDAGVVATDVTQVVENAMPSIVSIDNTYTETGVIWGRTYSQESESTGSGIIIGENDDELIIATNNHVVEDADTLTVHFIDDAEAEAFVKGTDEDMDLAVVAVEKDSLTEDTLNAISIATLGDSDELKVGEAAIAIGNALGYGQSVTTGVISALDRQITLTDGSLTDALIQTDAAINPGNSGGALLNMKGEVIGINSNKIGGSTVEGMGYAIPISAATPILEELQTKKTKIATEESEKGYLGISGRGITSDISQMYGFPEGIYVYEVYQNTGADYAGLQKGDIITKFDGSTVSSMEELRSELDYYGAGEKVQLTVMRADESGTYREIEVELTLSRAEDLPQD